MIRWCIVSLALMAVIAWAAIPKPPVLEPSTLMTIQVHGTPDAGEIATFGLPIAEGRVRPGDQVLVTRTNGSILTTQWNEMAYWRTDGSVLHGVVSFVIPEGLSTTDDLNVVAIPATQRLMAAEK